MTYQPRPDMGQLDEPTETGNYRLALVSLCAASLFVAGVCVGLIIDGWMP